MCTCELCGCVSVCIRQGGKIKAAGEACLQSFKSLARLLYLSDWQFLSGGLVWTAFCSGIIERFIVLDSSCLLIEPFIHQIQNVLGWWEQHDNINKNIYI